MSWRRRQGIKVDLTKRLFCDECSARTIHILFHLLFPTTQRCGSQGGNECWRPTTEDRYSWFSFFLAGYFFSASLQAPLLAILWTSAFLGLCSVPLLFTQSSLALRWLLFFPSQLHCHPSAKEYSESILSQDFLELQTYISSYQPDIFSWMDHRHIISSRCKTCFFFGVFSSHQVAQA